MNRPEDDREFEEFLQHRSPLLRRMSELDGAQPPAELDRAVLAHARNAIGTRGGAAPVRRGPVRWMLPAGLAASALLASVIALRAGRETIPFAPEPSVASRDAPAAAPRAAKPSIPPPFAAERESAPAPAPAPAPAAAPAQPQALERDARSANAIVFAPATVGVIAAAPDVPPPAAVRKSAATRAEATAARAAGAAADAARAPQRTPEQWLAEIRRLRAAGESERAQREWLEFRRAWPEYEVPDAAPPR